MSAFDNVVQTLEAMVDEGGETTPFNYVDEAHVTLSRGYHGDRITLIEFMDTLNRAIVVSEQMDRIKKALFYGKGGMEGFTETPNCGELPDRIGENGDIVMHGVIGLFTEAGEMLTALRDTLSLGLPLDTVNIKEESGDTKWYLAILSRVCGFVWGDDERANIAKLRTRYPHRFREYDANNRNVAAERAVLEA